MSRPTYTIATSIFNVVRMGFAWEEALDNWLRFLGEDGQLVVAINTSDDDTPAKVRAWVEQWRQSHFADRQPQIDVIDIAIPYTDPAFDGLGKAAATDAATQPFVILLDIDERLVPSMRRKWDALALELERSQFEAFLVPSIDLIGDEEHFKDPVGAKWYLHKRLPHLTRGVVAQARQADGPIDTSKSDTCELIHRDTAELARTAHVVAPGMPSYITVPQLESGEVPFVYHLGWLDAEQRLRQSDFWAPVWTARRGGKDPEPKQTLESLAAIPRFPHHLPGWREERS